MLLSVIIPTYKRSTFLPKAITSALHLFDKKDIEIIVVPNGSDDSWKIVAAQFASNPQVHWSPISKPHGNAARNHGLKIARGMYVKFLDDDDSLLPGTIFQVETAKNKHLEICSGSVDLVNLEGKLYCALHPITNSGFIESILDKNRKTGLQYHLYQKSAISSFVFDEDINVGQDTYWSHTLCQKREWNWGTIQESVCTWVQHGSTQISAKYGPSHHLKLQEKALWDTIIALKGQHRLTENRASIAAEGMWHLIHCGYFLSPFHWYGVIQKMNVHFPGIFPSLKIYDSEIGRKIPPLFLESTMLPKRWINHLIRQHLARTDSHTPWSS